MDNAEILVSIKHLWNTSSTITNSDHIAKLIRNHILIKCITKCQYDFKLPAKYFGPEARCSNCSSQWKDNYSIQFTKRKKLSKRYRRKYKLIAENRNGLRTQGEIEKAKVKISPKTLLIKCLHCDKVTKSNLSNNQNKNKLEDSKITPHKLIGNKSDSLPLEKRKSKTPQSISRNIQLKKSCYLTPSSMLHPKPGIVSTPGVTPTARGKNKRQRDKFAGLSKMACMSSSPSPKINNPLHLLMKMREN